MWSGLSGFDYIIALGHILSSILTLEGGLGCGWLPFSRYIDIQAEFFVHSLQVQSESRRYRGFFGVPNLFGNNYITPFHL